MANSAAEVCVGGVTLKYEIPSSLTAALVQAELKRRYEQIEPWHIGADPHRKLILLAMSIALEGRPRSTRPSRLDVVVDGRPLRVEAEAAPAEVLAAAAKVEDAVGRFRSQNENLADSGKAVLAAAVLLLLENG